MTNTFSKWDYRWIERAKTISLWSKDPSTQIGCVFVDEESKQELSVGYNGFPRGIVDDERLLDRSLKYPRVVHAEMNGIFNAVNRGISLEGSTLYVYGLHPCNECAKGIIQVGVKSIVVKQTSKDSVNRWDSSVAIANEMFNEVGIGVTFMEG